LHCNKRAGAQKKMENKTCAFRMVTMLIIVTIYSVLAYEAGKRSGIDTGWRLATQNHDFPTTTQIANMAEVCK